MQVRTYPLPIYVISLTTDIQRRIILENQLESLNKAIQYIDAVDGREMSATKYFQHALPLYKEKGHLMTPTEVGCALSHLKAMEFFIKSGEPYVLILEDDIIANDNKIMELTTLAPLLPPTSMLIAGGQEGIKSSRLLGKHYKNNMYKLPTYSHPYVTRACSYILTRQAAVKIIQHHKNTLTIADWWADILDNTGVEMFYKEVIAHPLDLKNSLLEKERVLLYKKERKNIKQRIIKELARFSRNTKRIFLMLQGYKPI